MMDDAMVTRTLADRCKSLEQPESDRAAVAGSCLVARYDGRAFHTFTKGLARPYDERMSQSMIAATKALVRDSRACIGYTQSDEITLVWGPGRYPFDGRFQKVSSVYAGLASVAFCESIRRLVPEKADKLPVFDGRAWQVASVQDVIDVFLWRERDAIKNSISAAAHTVFSHKTLLGKRCMEMQQMLLREGIDWTQYPSFFRRGTYVHRQVVESRCASMSR
jgi:tRNA(His) 5'-end guanylyltransferase